MGNNKKNDVFMYRYIQSIERGICFRDEDLALAPFWGWGWIWWHDVFLSNF